MQWTEEELDAFPVQGDFRLRGVEMTRLETYTDAAFAFAMTVLVVSGERIPQTYDEMLAAIKGVPAFAASFAQIMLFWIGHRSWSRRFGLEDKVTTLITLVLIFVMLVYVYPLKAMFSAFFEWMSGGFLPSEFAVTTAAEMTGLFVIYGVGAAAMAGSLAGLHLRSERAASGLGLNSLERLRTRQQRVFWSVQAGVSLLSASFALFLSPRIGVYAGFLYFLLPILMPWLAIRFEKKAEALKSATAE